MAFDDLTPDEAARLLDALFPPGSNARAILDSTPPHARAAMDQAFAHAAAREQERALRDMLFRLLDPDEWQREQEELRRYDEEMIAAMDAMTPGDWADLDAAVREAERDVLRERGIQPLE